MKDIFIGIDIGTSSTKIVVADNQSAPLFDISRTYSLLTPKPGYVEQDAVEILNAIFDGLEEAIPKAIELGEIRGIGLSSAMHSLLLLDRDDQPLSPAITWADKRSESEAASLQSTLEGQDIYARTGTPIHPMSPLCKLIWLKKYQPEVLEQTARVLSIKEYFVFKLTGHFLIDHSIASATGLFDLYNREWYAPALALAGIDASQLSRPTSTTSILPPIKTQHQQKLGISSEVPWIIGASDGCLANLGVHATTPAQAAITIGTSGAIRVTTHEPFVDNERRLFTYILDDNRYIVGGSINNGGISLKWFQDQLLSQSGSEALKRNLKSVAQIAPGAEGMVCLPYLLGERAPHWNSYDRGVFFGVQFQHTAIHFLRAMLEGITMTLQQIGEAIEDTCGGFEMLLANGGVLQSPEWLQIIADVFGKPVIVQQGEDASAMGAILLTMQALGIERDRACVDTISEQGRRILPDPDTHAVYERILPIFSDLYRKLKDDFIRLKSI